MTGSRRRLLGLGLALGALAAGWQIFGVRRGSTLEFRPVSGLPDYRFATSGGVSAAVGADWMLLGLDFGETRPLMPADEVPLALYPATPRPPGVVVAVFSDFFCPYCRGLTERIARRAERGDISVWWHELPLLSPASEFVARAALAAQGQGGYVAFLGALTQMPFRPSIAVMREAAVAADLDPNRLARDMNAAYVEEAIVRAADLARRLGIFGTPGLVVGRSVVVGEISDDILDDLIEEEKTRQA